MTAVQPMLPPGKLGVATAVGGGLLLAAGLLALLRRPKRCGVEASWVRAGHAGRRGRWARWGVGAQGSRECGSLQRGRARGVEHVG